MAMVLGKRSTVNLSFMIYHPTLLAACRMRLVRLNQMFKVARAGSKARWVVTNA